MILLVSGATRDVAKHPTCGVLVSPRNRNSITSIADSGRSWAADNDAFKAWDQERFETMLEAIGRVDRSRLLWIACPDVVADAGATIERWDEWFPRIDGLGLPAAFIGQDNLEDMTDRIPWNQMAAFFIGGSDEWKLSAAAENLAREAKKRGKWLHGGRVNSSKRTRHMMEIGADSMDGGGFSTWPKNISKGLRWIKKHRERPSLF
jgi:hypothetical protein